MKKLIIHIKQLPHGADLPLPEYATNAASGMDLLAAISEPIVLKPFQRKLIPTGISIEIPPGYEAQIRPRSGLALKHGITVLNTPGTIDADYRGEIGVILINFGEKDFTVERGMKIAQMVISKVYKASLVKADSLNETQRNTAGFGSTGIKINS